MRQKQQETKPKTHHGLKIAALVLAVVLVGSMVAFGVYTAGYSRAGGAAVAVPDMQGLTIQKEKGYTALVPEEAGPVGYVFYPGGLVDENAYLPYLAGIALEGYTCAVLQVPFHLAVLAPNRAGKVLDDFPGIAIWAVGGHSLGGVMAADYAAKHTDSVAGLVLLAAYPNRDISTSGLRVLDITATNDEVLNREKHTGAADNYPASTQFRVIEGGNHAGFGDYGAQKGDGAATIPQSGQWAESAAYTVALLEELAGAINEYF